jgi:hypothetical protein
MSQHQNGSGATTPTATAGWREKLGWLLIIAGGILILVGYIGVSGQDTEALQLPYLASGGIGGLAVIAVGAALLISADVRLDRERLGRIEGELLELGDLVRSLTDRTAARP